MANESDGPPIWFWLGILVAALLGGVGIIIAAVKIARGIAPVWILYLSWFVFFGLIVLLAVVIAVYAVIIASRSTAWAFRKTIDEMAKLETRYPKQFVKIKKRTPTIVAVAILISEAVVIIADRSFEGNTIAALGVSFVMLIGFSMANESHGKEVVATEDRRGCAVAAHRRFCARSDND